MDKEYIEMVDVEYQVEEKDKKNVYVPGMAKDMIIGGRDSGNVFLFCLNDELRKSIAAQVAEKLEREFVVVSRSDGNPVLEKLAAGDNQIISLPRGAAKSAKIRELLKSNGKVIFIMCDFTALLAASDGSEDAREQISLMLNRFEPSFMEAAHHIVRSDQSEEEILQDVLDKIAI
ncbi:shikimate kinase [Maridesulfovibrio sp.]|jgi:shikimate kinase|uniref:shikimate kinase n=1 Tax=Maridesulfovibrio sp. TaxID=2795000 RepID=UPI0029CA2D36|nr:shikimate kinase [Maridesulfovibrio sp.]